MEEIKDKKSEFVSYLDDDNKQKDCWVVILEETGNYIKFKYNNEILTIPWHRILKVKRKEGTNEHQF